MCCRWEMLSCAEINRAFMPPSISTNYDSRKMEHAGPQWEKSLHVGANQFDQMCIRDSFSILSML